MDRQPSTRGKVMQEQIELLGLAEGFFQSSILFAMQRLGVFVQVGTAGSTLDALAASLHAPPETTRSKTPRDGLRKRAS